MRIEAEVKHVGYSIEQHDLLDIVVRHILKREALTITDTTSKDWSDATSAMERELLPLDSSSKLYLLKLFG